MTALFQIVWRVFISFFVAYFIVVAYWLWWPYEPIIIQGPIKILNEGKLVKAGQLLCYQITYKKTMKIDGVLTRKLVNDYTMDLRASYATAKVGDGVDNVKVWIPTHATPGKYTLWWSVAYKVNPLRTVSVAAESESFYVMASDESKGEKGDKGDPGEKGKTGATGKDFWGK